ncbi:unnamed protein product [Hymenolepis diminuta]|uniref:Kinesin motor domain-containing protein n=1 Tax=Hymenolepis diminuta TaxID=6216 RepID=A0A0R3SWF1_HYMDI|nr:unnamed protein product [Hymenolepis diminuta]
MSPVKIYGQKSVTLDRGLHGTFCWIFIISDVSKPITGADSFCHFSLLLNFSRTKLLDPLTNFHSKCTECPCPDYRSITCIQASESPFYPILKLFLILTNPVRRDKPVNHSVTYFIITHGNSVKVRVRSLSSTRYKIAKDEFEHMPDLGIIHRSSSNWSSALHVVPKKSGD